MKWLLICIALASNPMDKGRDLFVFDARFNNAEECKTYAMINSQEVQETVIPEIGPFAAFCVTEQVFEEQIIPGLEKKEPTKLQGDYI